MKKLVKIAFVVLSLTFMSAASLKAQDKFEADLGVDIVNNYVFRGMKLGNASIQPYAGIYYKGLALETWGSYGFANPADDEEIDFTLSYSIAGLRIGLADYFVIDETDPSFFVYKKDETSHVFEAFVEYDFDFLQIGGYVNFAGCDVWDDGRSAYSTYFEVSAPFSFATLDWTATVGFSPFASPYYETEGFAVNNISLMAEKEIPVTDRYSIPIFAAFTVNPYANKVFLTFGLSF